MHHLIKNNNEINDIDTYIYMQVYKHKTETIIFWIYMYVLEGISTHNTK